MARKKKDKPEETQKPGELTAVDETVAEPEPEPEPEPGAVNAALLADLPLPAFQRITALPVGSHVAAVENSKRSLMFVRGSALLYAAGVVAKTKATDLPAELKALGAACAAGRGGDVFALADLMAEVRRRNLKGSN